MGKKTKTENCVMKLKQIINEGKKLIQLPLTGRVKLKGDSQWTDTKGDVAKVTGVVFEIWPEDIEDGTGYPLIWVKHDLNWEIYTDSGFEKGISDLLTKKLKSRVLVSFTEQGMQKNKKASMQANNNSSEKVIMDYIMKTLKKPAKKKR